MPPIRYRTLALWLWLTLGACGVAEGPVEFTNEAGAAPELRSATAMGVAGAAGAGGAESD